MICVFSRVTIGRRRLEPTNRHLEEWLSFAQHSKDRSMVCWVITTQFKWCPGLEDMGVQMLLNENQPIERGNQRIYLAGMDDAHF